MSRWLPDVTTACSYSARLVIKVAGAHVALSHVGWLGTVSRISQPRMVDCPKDVADTPKPQRRHDRFPLGRARGCWCKSQTD